MNFHFHTTHSITSKLKSLRWFIHAPIILFFLKEDNLMETGNLRLPTKNLNDYWFTTFLKIYFLELIKVFNHSRLSKFWLFFLTELSLKHPDLVSNIQLLSFSHMNSWCSFIGPKGRLSDIYRCNSLLSSSKDSRCEKPKAL